MRLEMPEHRLYRRRKGVRVHSGEEHARQYSEGPQERSGPGKPSVVVLIRIEHDGVQVRYNVYKGR